MPAPAASARSQRSTAPCAVGPRRGRSAAAKPMRSTRLVDVRDAQFDVGRQRRAEQDPAARADHAADRLGQAVDGDHRARIADVERLADRGRVLERAQHALDHVVDEAPGADLRAVAEDQQVLVLQRLAHEDRQSALAGLARAIDVERPHGHCRQAVLFEVCVRQVLARQLTDRIGPARLADRAGDGLRTLADLEGLRAENLGGRKLEEALDAAHLLRRLQRVGGADHVDAHRGHGIAHSALDAGDGRRMHHDLCTSHARLQAFEIEHVAFDLSDVRMAVVGRVPEGIARVVVIHDDAVVLR